MKVYVVYNSKLHLSRKESTEDPNTYVSLCGKTDAHDIRDYAKNGGAKIYPYADVKNSKVGSLKFDGSICRSCFSEARGTLNEVPPEFRDRLYPSARAAGSPSSVAADGGEIQEHVDEGGD